MIFKFSKSAIAEEFGKSRRKPTGTRPRGRPNGSDGPTVWSWRNCEYAQLTEKSATEKSGKQRQRRRKLLKSVCGDAE